MADFEIGGIEYRAERLPALKQGHLSRRLAPLIPPLGPLFMRLAKSVNSAGGVLGNLDALAPLAQPFMDGLAAMSDEDFEYVINLCLSNVKRNNDGNWAAIWNPSAKAAMFADLNDIGALMPIVLQVMKDNLGPFISGILTRAQQAPAATA